MSRQIFSIDWDVWHNKNLHQAELEQQVAELQKKVSTLSQEKAELEDLVNKIYEKYPHIVTNE